MFLRSFVILPVFIHSQKKKRERTAYIRSAICHRGATSFLLGPCAGGGGGGGCCSPRLSRHIALTTSHRRYITQSSGERPPPPSALLCP